MLSVSSTVNGWGRSVSSWWRPAPLPVVVVPTPLSQRAPLLPQDAALAALSVVGAAALLTAAWNCYGPRPFPRGRQSRSRASLPFANSAECPVASVVHQFYTPDQFRFITLSHGSVRYILRSPPGSSSPPAVDESDPGSNNSYRNVVVLVHGFSIAADIWKQQADYFVDQGFTVLSFDNYGRGWSDAPEEAVSMNPDLYVGQLAELLFALNIRSPVSLCGVSMGGAIVAAFAATYPQAVARLCLMCPAGLPIATPAAMSKMVTLPFGIGGFLFLQALKSMQAKGANAQWEKNESDMYGAWGKYAGQNIQEHPGFSRTLHRTLLEFSMNDQRQYFTKIAATDSLNKILIIWGEKDGLTPYSNATVLHSLLPKSQLVTIVSAKHNMLIERPQPICEVMTAWLKNSEAKLPARVHTTIDDQAQQEQQQHQEGQ